MHLRDLRGELVHLGYCTNVHAGRSLVELERNLGTHALRVQEQFGEGEPFSVGLWFSREMLEELGRPGRAQALKAWLDERSLYAVTVNAFPYGDFHADRVKEKVYEPDWTTPQRFEYTLGSARALAELLPEGARGSISTLPGGASGVAGQTGGDGTADEQRRDAIASAFVRAAWELHRLGQETGRDIVLCPEPEPCCLWETGAELLRFLTVDAPEALARLRKQGAVPADFDEAALARHLGACVDVCHHAVMYENLADVIANYRRAGVTVGKLQLSSAIQLLAPGEHENGRRALQAFEDSRYLHQVVARVGDERRDSLRDLPELFHPGNEHWRAYDCWRVHYHIPIYLEKLPHLQTTRSELRVALREALAHSPAPHLEIETYTWSAVPDRARRVLRMDTLAGCLACEYEWTLIELADLGVYR